MATDVAAGPVMLDLRKTREKLVDDVDCGAKRWPPQHSLQQRGILSEPRPAAETTAWLESPNVGTPCRKGLFGRVSRTVDENSSGGAGTEMKNEPWGAVLLPFALRTSARGCLPTDGRSPTGAGAGGRPQSRAHRHKGKFFSQLSTEFRSSSHDAGRVHFTRGDRACSPTPELRPVTSATAGRPRPRPRRRRTLASAACLS